MEEEKKDSDKLVGIIDDIISSADGSVRQYNALENLRQNPSSELIRLLITALKDKFSGYDIEHRYELFYYVGKKLNEIDNPMAGEALIYILNFAIKNKSDLENKNVGGRWSQIINSAVVAIGNIKDSRAVEPLINLLTVPHASFISKGRIACALGKIKDSRAISPLIDELFSPLSNSPHDVIANALTQITGNKFSFGNANPKKWLNWWKENRWRFEKK